MNILVTGATGFIGKHLISYLSKRHNLYILVRSGSNCTFLNVNNVFVFSENIDELAAYLRKEKIDGRSEERRVGKECRFGWCVGVGGGVC